MKKFKVPVKVYKITSAAPFSGTAEVLLLYILLFGQYDGKCRRSVLAIYRYRPSMQIAYFFHNSKAYTVSFR